MSDKPTDEELRDFAEWLGQSRLQRQAPYKALKEYYEASEGFLEVINRSESPAKERNAALKRFKKARVVLKGGGGT